MSNSSFYDFHCPLGGKWYACASGSKFVGCCTSDPCSSTGCSLGNLRAGAFNKTQHGNFPDASCGTSSQFWSCVAGDSFWGCCKENPCSTGTCPSGDLTPAFLDRPDLFDAYLATDDGKASSGSGKTNTGAIVGGVVGGVVVLAIIVVIIFVVLRRRKNKKAAGGDMGAATMMPMMNKEKGDQSGAAIQYGGQSPPPTYSGPIQNTYQASSPGKGHESYHQYASHAMEPQELPAEPSSSHGQRFSELPAGASNVMDNRRFSELPAEGAGPTGPSELESPVPYVTPQPLQEEFSNDVAKRSSHPQGLGLSTGK